MKHNSSEVWPNLFIVGAPRSGTTFLYGVLDSHPSVFMSKVKEPNFFSTPPIPERHKHVLGATQDKQKYLSMFARAKKDNVYIGEGTTHYLSDLYAAKNISNKSRNAKIIVVIRNPIERAHSAYLLLGRRGENEVSFYDTMIDHINNVNNPERSFGNFALQGLYTSQLARFYNHFPANQILVIDFDDIKKNQDFVLSQLSEFLGLPKNGFVVEKSRKNSHKQPRGKLTRIILKNDFLSKLTGAILPRKLVRFIRDRILLKKTSKEDVDQKSKILLEDFFNEELSNYNNLLSKNQQR